MFDDVILCTLASFWYESHYLYFALVSKKFFRALQHRQQPYKKITMVSVETLKWAVSLKYDVSHGMIDLVAITGDLSLLQWTLDRYDPDAKYCNGIFKGTQKLRDTTFACAASSGNLELVKWLWNQGCPWSSYACARAAKAGHWRILRWLRDHGCPWDRRTTAAAAAGGHLRILQNLRKEPNPCPWTNNVCSLAALGGHKDVIVWARSQNCKWSVETCQNALRGHHFELFRYLRTEGCPWDERSTQEIAILGRLDLLIWAREFNPPCPWTTWTSNFAAAAGHLELLQWAIGNGCPVDGYSIVEAAQNGHLEIIKYLHTLNLEKRDLAMLGALKRGDTVTVKWLHEHGYPWHKLSIEYTNRDIFSTMLPF